MWKKTKKGFKARVKLPAFSASEAVETVYADSYVSLSVKYEGNEIEYRVVVDQRRTYTCLSDKNWVSLFFDKREPGVVRTSLKGTRVWEDKLVVLSQFGSKPRTYVAVLKESKTRK